MRHAKIDRVSPWRAKRGRARLRETYELLGELGRGAMGRVIEARRRADGARVIIKTLIDGDASPAARERYRREALALAELRHPNNIASHGYGVEQGQSFLVRPTSTARGDERGAV